MVYNPKPTLLRSFLAKTHDLIETAPTEIIEWTDDGEAFIVKAPKRLEKEILHKYFKHSNFRSFSRQLSLYHFQKSNQYMRLDASDVMVRCWEYRHENFKRGRMDLMTGIKRKGPAVVEDKKELEHQLDILTARVNKLRAIVHMLVYKNKELEF